MCATQSPELVKVRVDWSAVEDAPVVNPAN